MAVPYHQCLNNSKTSALSWSLSLRLWEWRFDFITSLIFLFFARFTLNCTRREILPRSLSFYFYNQAISKYFVEIMFWVCKLRKIYEGTIPGLYDLPKLRFQSIHSSPTHGSWNPVRLTPKYCLQWDEISL